MCVCVNMAHALMRSMGRRRCEPPEPADEAGGEKPQLNARNLALQGGAAHRVRRKE
jgi:hypothetical protein